MSLIIEWLFPKSCCGCRRGGKYLCNLCESQMKTGLLIRKEPFEGIISVYKYDALMKEIIEKIKYEFTSDIIGELAQLMGKKLKIDYPNIIKYWQEEKFCLIPIPLYWQRKNWRGFNQSEILGKDLAKILNLKYDGSILTRDIKTKNQAKIKNRQLRQKNIENVFKTSSNKKVPEKIILVDDVITSGATLTAALKTLRQSRKCLGWGLGLSGGLK